MGDDTELSWEGEDGEDGEAGDGLPPREHIVFPFYPPLILPIWQICVISIRDQLSRQSQLRNQACIYQYGSDDERYFMKFEVEGRPKVQ